MDLRILTATKGSCVVASDCAGRVTIALGEVGAACDDFDGSGKSADRIHRAVDRLSARCDALSRCAGAVYDNAWNISRG